MVRVVFPDTVAPGATSHAERASAVAASYDALAPTYDAAHPRPIDRAEDAVIARKLRQIIGPSDRVADLGCGTGLVPLLLNLPPDRYVGVDVSTGMLEQARAKLPEHRFVHADMTRTPLASHVYDVVVSTFGSVSYEPSPILVVDEAARLLDHGGRLLLVAATPGYQARMSYVLNGVQSLMAPAPMEA